ncbi:MAG: winged helix-turn-helix domain-containing protein [Saprospiraceae bacterium]|nr:winged helix-turn-helix domain-containing protein [Lewinella sp.]
MESPIHFNAFHFYPDRGELVYRKGEPAEATNRLAPQPNKLLLLLLEKYPGIVSQEEIKKAIWPEVQVDFESSLHYCIRQIRSALNDRASDPVYIETIPRRGYRWLVLWERIDSDKREKERRPAVSKRLIPALFLILLSSFFIGRSLLKPSTEAQVPVRVAIMSFQPLTDSSAFAGNDISLQLVERLTRGYPNIMEVIGPTTTDRYPSSGSLENLVEDLDIDIILNGRFAPADPTDRLLAEVIRASDGAHIWVKYFEPGTDPELIVKTIMGGLQERYSSQLNREAGNL